MAGIVVPSALIAFFAGILSFLSPCILPLVPSYLSFIGGSELRNTKKKGWEQPSILLRMGGFVLGFSLVFVGLSLLISVSRFFIPLRAITIVSGLIITVFGLHITFDLFKVLNREKRFHPTSNPTNFFSAFSVGLAFGGGWTPCVGPVLASILSLAASEEGLSSSIVLLSLYSTGLAVPFILATLFFPFFMRAFPAFKKHSRGFRIACGLLLIITGVLMLSNRLSLLNQGLVSMSRRLEMWSHLPYTSMLSAIFLIVLSFLPLIRSIIERKRPGIPSICVASCFFILAILEGTGIIYTVSSLASWLLYSGI